jgi:hypothetical protein
MHRLALLAILLFCPFAMSGCDAIYIFCLKPLLGEDFCKDTPVYDEHPPASGVRTSAGGTPFTGTARGQLTGKLTIKHFPVKSKIKNARFFGDFTATPKRNSAALGPLSSAQWHGKFGGTRNRKTGRINVKGLVLATFDDAAAGRACLKVTHRATRKQKRARFKKRSKSTVKVVGGEGGARTLHGTANVRLKLKSTGVLKMNGTVKQRRGAARGFTPACTKLEKKFGLQPVAR